MPMAIFLADLCQAVNDRWPDKKVDVHPVALNAGQFGRIL